jgi:murein DD-endopeptidase MepM/ murein hydrolase activator NlpD
MRLPGSSPAGPGPAAAGGDPRLREAAQALESMLLRQVVVASGAFKGGEMAGAGIRADVFAQTLSDALARGGGIGLADLLERSLAGSLAPGGPPGTLPGAAPGAGAPARALPGPLPLPAGPDGATAALRRPAPGDGGPAPRLYLARPGPAAPPAPGSALSPPAPDPGGSLRLSHPVAGAPTSSPFGLRSDPFTGHPAHHAGLDLAAPEGTPVEASAPGVVVQAGWRPGYGLAVELDHGRGVTTLYAHASEILVSPGQSVARGEPVARVGDTGRSTGPHLHFEVRTRGTPVDPRRALSAYQPRADEPHGSGFLTAARVP